MSLILLLWMWDWNPVPSAMCDERLADAAAIRAPG